MEKTQTRRQPPPQQTHVASLRPPTWSMPMNGRSVQGPSWSWPLRQVVRPQWLDWLGFVCVIFVFVLFAWMFCFVFCVFFVYMTQMFSNVSEVWNLICLNVCCCFGCFMSQTTNTGHKTAKNETVKETEDITSLIKSKPLSSNLYKIPHTLVLNNHPHETLLRKIKRKSTRKH